MSKNKKAEKFVPVVPEGVNQVIAGMVEAFLDDQPNYELDLDALQLRIHLTGSKWAGVVDKPIAKFLLDLDQKLHDELSKLGVTLPENTHGLVALRIEDGSLDAWLQYGKGMMSEIRKMKNSDKIFVLTALLLAFGIPSAEKIINAVNAPAVEERKSLEREKLVETMAELVESTRPLQQPLRALVDKMEPSDVIDLPSTPDQVSKDTIKTAFVKATRSKTTSYYIDHPYVIEELATKTPGKWTVALSYADVSFRAGLMLSHDQVSKLLEDFQDAHARGANIAPDLQIVAEVNEKGIRSASVIGIGKPRPDSKKLSEVLADEAGKAAAPDEGDSDGVQ